MYIYVCMHTVHVCMRARVRAHERVCVRMSVCGERVCERECVCERELVGVCM